jgi:adenylate cyclase
MKIFTSIWMACITFVLLVMIRLWDPVPIETLRLKMFDYLQSTKENTKSSDIVLMDIGEQSLEMFGQWPWPRDYFAKIITTLRANGAQLITFVVFFPEDDRMGKDIDFTQALTDNPGVILSQTATNTAFKTHGKHIGHSAIGDRPDNWLPTYRGLVKNIDTLESAAEGVGMIATAPEVDNLVRRVPLIIRVGDQIYPNLAIEFIRVATGDPSYQVKTGDSGVQAIRVPGFNIIKTDSYARSWIDFSRTFDRLEVSDKDWSIVSGKHVFVGTTAAGLANLISTPRGLVYPHEIQASLVQTIMDDTFIQRKDFSDMLEAIIFAIFGIALLILVPRTSVMYTIPLIIAYISAFGYYSYWEWNTEYNLVDASYPMIAGFILFSHLVYNNFARENRLKQQIRKQFSTYLSPALVSRLQKNPERLILGGDERELSIMFTDVRGFTTISEHYGSNVQGLTQIMNRYMTAMTAKIIENNGTLDKYIGDAQMAFWNAPLDEPKHAHMAVKTALQMMESLDEFNKEIVAEGVPPFGMGLGINTGVVVVGNMGSDQRFDYTCLGDHVNLASRLEGQSKGYGVRIILGQRTAELVKDEYPVVELDCIAVKGKTIGVKIFTVGKTNHVLHNQYLEAYYRGDWTRAKTQCEKIIAIDGELKHYYELMLDRMTQGLPSNWDGTYHATSK